MPKLSPSIARYIGSKVYGKNGSIRDCLSIAKLLRKSDGPTEIEMIMNTLVKYSEAEKK